jgi:hypothetical protein
VSDQFAEILAGETVPSDLGTVPDGLNGITEAIRGGGGIEWLHILKAVMNGRGGEVIDFATAGDAAYITEHSVSPRPRRGIGGAVFSRPKRVMLRICLLSGRCVTANPASLWSLQRRLRSRLPTHQLCCHRGPLA